jgi:serine-type D-Ala-D-Ala endopeptidase (penicillin-binding protein 7)
MTANRTQTWWRSIQSTFAVALSAAVLWGASGAAFEAQAKQKAKPAAAKSSAKASAKGAGKPSAKTSAKTTTARATLSRADARGAKGKAVLLQGGKASTKRGVRRAVYIAPPPPSFGQQAGLHAVEDELQLKSGVALVVDQDTNEVLLRKNDSAVLPIASLTKLMTGLVISEAGLPMDRSITITEEDIDTVKGSRSRLEVGTTLSRAEMLHLALMSSENRAAHALGRTYPGGLRSFNLAMNQKARELGMRDTRFVEPTGLSSDNQSSARDLAVLVKAASQHQVLRELSTSMGSAVPVGVVGDRLIEYRNTNGLVQNPNWQIGLQKTGYIREAGNCLVMQAKVAGRNLVMVFLDSAGKYSRLGDAERVRQWLEAINTDSTSPAARKSPQS